MPGLPGYDQPVVAPMLEAHGCPAAFAASRIDDAEAALLVCAWSHARLCVAHVASHDVALYSTRVHTRGPAVASAAALTELCCVLWPEARHTRASPSVRAARSGGRRNLPAAARGPKCTRPPRHVLPCAYDVRSSAVERFDRVRGALGTKVPARTSGSAWREGG
jgi:hypothetical protein